MNMLDRVMPAGLVDLHLGPLPVGAMASMAVVFSASLAVAVASWHLFERHVLAWKDRLAPRESAAGAASAASGPHRRPEGARAAFDSD
jgi:peptidoglycan/LPS O-acetylase OafA/YrhL